MNTGKGGTKQAKTNRLPLGRFDAKLAQGRLWLSRWPEQ